MNIGRRTFSAPSEVLRLDFQVYFFGTALSASAVSPLPLFGRTFVDLSSKIELRTRHQILRPSSVVRRDFVLFSAKLTGRYDISCTFERK